MAYRDDNPEEQPLWGDIEFYWKDGGTPAVRFNQLAHSGRGELLFVSLVAETQRIKQIRAALCASENSKKNTYAMAGGVKTAQPNSAYYWANTPGRLTPSADGYTVYQHKLSEGEAHALFITRSPGFLMLVSEESLWRELNSPRFTTPILRAWMPYIEQQLRDRNRLEDAHVFNCHCGVLTATTKVLDEIVEEGIKQGRLLIPDQEESEAA